MTALQLIRSRPFGFFPALQELEGVLEGGQREQVRQLRLKATVQEFDDRFELSLDVPGIAQTDLDIEIKKGTLTVTGERKLKETEQGAHGKLHFSEQIYGTFSRSFKLPETVGSDHIKAKYDAGVLSITLPKTPEAAPTKISIASAAQ